MSEKIYLIRIIDFTEWKLKKENQKAQIIHGILVALGSMMGVKGQWGGENAFSEALIEQLFPGLFND